MSYKFLAAAPVATMVPSLHPSEHNRARFSTFKPFGFKLSIRYQPTEEFGVGEDITGVTFEVWAECM